MSRLLNYHVPTPEMKQFIIHEKIRCEQLKRQTITKHNVIELVRCQRTINTLEAIYPILKKTE